MNTQLTINPERKANRIIGTRSNCRGPPPQSLTSSHPRLSTAGQHASPPASGKRISDSIGFKQFVILLLCVCGRELCPVARISALQRAAGHRSFPARLLPSAERAEEGHPPPTSCALQKIVRNANLFSRCIGWLVSKCSNQCTEMNMMNALDQQSPDTHKKLLEHQRQKYKKMEKYTYVPSDQELQLYKRLRGHAINQDNYQVYIVEMSQFEKLALYRDAYPFLALRKFVIYIKL